jgi:hypothetical protein
VGDVATLLTAIAGLVTTLGGTFALVWTTVHRSNRERPAAARGVAEELAAAAADGELTADEIDAVLTRIRERDDEGGA